MKQSEDRKIQNRRPIPLIGLRPSGVMREAFRGRWPWRARLDENDVRSERPVLMKRYARVVYAAFLAAINECRP
jgi:hypothetical protein